MSARVGRVMLGMAVGMLISLDGCGESGQSKQDKTSKLDRSAFSGLEPSSALDAVTKDGKTSNDGPSICSPPKNATVNSGKSCTIMPDSGSACAAGEGCVIDLQNAAHKSVSMCLGLCCPDLTKDVDDPVNLCPGTDTAKNIFSSCWWGLEGRTEWVCAYVCSYEDTAGNVKTFNCPADYDCVVDDPDYPNDKVCVPKA